MMSTTSPPSSSSITTAKTHVASVFQGIGDAKVSYAAGKLLCHIVTNLLLHPNEEKYTSLNVTKINARLSKAQEAVRVLTQDVGFVIEGDRYVLPAQGSNVDLSLLKQQLDAWMSTLAPQQQQQQQPAKKQTTVSTTTPAIKPTTTTTTTTTTSWKKKSKATNSRREELRRQFEQQRKEANEKFVVSSKANDLAFGATFVKVQLAKDDPPPKKKG